MKAKSRDAFDKPYNFLPSHNRPFCSDMVLCISNGEMTRLVGPVSFNQWKLAKNGNKVIGSCITLIPCFIVYHLTP